VSSSRARKEAKVSAFADRKEVGPTFRVDFLHRCWSQARAAFAAFIIVFFMRFSPAQYRLIS
jgi:hypothetical protein